MRNLLVASFVLTLALTIPLVSQGSSAFPFLLITSSPVSNGMGQASAGLPMADPLALDNPAQLGFLSLSTYSSVSYAKNDWLPQFMVADLWVRSYAAQGGINLRKLNPAMPELAIGFSRSQLYLNLGDMTVTSPNSPNPSGTFHSFESSDMSTISAALRYGVILSIGLTHKNIAAELGPIGVQGQNQPGIAHVGTYDFGMLAEVPLIDMANSLSMKTKIGSRITPLANISAGFSKNNMGDQKVQFVNSTFADFLPRHLRIGIGVQIGLNYQVDDEPWRMFGFSWTAEANDLLIETSPAVLDSNGDVVIPQKRDYRNDFGRIRFYNDLVAGNPNDETTRKRGWEVNLAELILVRGGRVDEGPTIGNRHLATSGLTICTGGLWKILRTIGATENKATLANYLLQHVNMQYSTSDLTPDDPNSPLVGTKQNGWMLLFTN